ncbi:DUF2326 domain-containing protein [Hymenobacter sp.]|jgi:uncharacterized protein YydD (DUF2326 family)|uniref:DUF2326 domain-containing protein n=1 Tax=Hymenobacter sp. TaxID=1898978 RepID=UPI002EDA7138
MKLKRLFASDGKFKAVVFNDGFNVVLASARSKENSNVDTHGVGKSTLIEVIDFMLLKEIDKSHFLRKHQFFAPYSFFLEIQLNSEQFLVIGRSVTADTKISFRVSSQPLQDNISVDDWDLGSVPIAKAKQELNRLLGFNIATTFTYRKSITYFLRGQSDYRDVFQLQKFGSGNHKDWKPFIFELLGFNPINITRKYNLETEIAGLVKIVGDVGDKFNIASSQIDKINGIIELRTEEKQAITAQLEAFSFHESDNKKILKADDIESRIAELNLSSYNIRYEIERVEQSLKSHSSFNTGELEALFNEVKLYFPKALKKEYEDLEQFNYNITVERNEYLQRQLQRLQDKLSKVMTELADLDARRAGVLIEIGTTKSFSKYKSYQKSLAAIEAELAKLQEQRNQLDIVSGITRQIDSLKGELKEVKSLIVEQLAERNSNYSLIRRRFRTFVHDVINAYALISLAVNANGNVDFKAEIMDEQASEVTSKAEGFSYKKLLCACFDLAVIITYRPNSFFRFAYHDGVLEGLDNRKKRLFVELAKRLCDEFNIQYILTVIEDDIPAGEEPYGGLFEDKDIILRLYDSSDEGKLFETSF